MRIPEPSDDWPESWRISQAYDLLEFGGSRDCLGYTYAYDARRAATLELVSQAAPRGVRVLDVAAAQGNFSLLLAELGYDVTWNDLRAELADYVRLKHEHGTITYAPGNVFEVEFPHKFDVIVATEIIEHVAHPDQFLQQLAALLTPGGHIVITTPNGGYFLNSLPRFSECEDPSVFESAQFRPNSDGHIFLLHEDEFPPLVGAAGLEIVDLRIFTNSLTNGHLKTESLLHVLPHLVIKGIEKLSQKLPGAIRSKVCVASAALLRRPSEA